MYHVFITLLWTLSLVFAQLLPYTFKNEVVNSAQIKNLVANMAQKFFVDESSLGVLLLDHDVNYIVSDIQVPVVIYSEEETIPCKITPIDLDGYVFVIRKPSFLVSKVIPALQCYNKTTLKLNTKNILIICIAKEECYNKEYYLQTFHMMWTDFGLINFVVLPASRNVFQLHPLVLAYNPFMKTESMKSGVLTTFSSTQYFIDVLENRFLNMHGYRLNAVIFPYNISVHPAFLDKPGSTRGGIDLTIRWALERQFNVCFVIHLPRDGKFHGINGNGTFTGALLDVISNNVDISLNARFMKWFSTPRIQFLMPRLDSAMIVLVKKKDPIEGWEVILHVFHWQVWAWIVSVTSLSCFISWLLKKVYLSYIGTEQVGNQLLDSVWMVLKSTVSMPVIRPPKLTQDRILMSTALWLSVVIVNLFLGQLFYFIKTKPRMANIDTFQELFDSNLPIFSYSETLTNTFDGFKNSSLSKLIDRLHFKNYSETLGGHGYPTKIAADNAVVHSTSLYRYQQVAEPSEFTETAHALKEHVYSFYLGLYMPIGSIYHKHFYKFTMKIFEFGFTGKWMQDYFDFIRESHYQPKLKGTYSNTDSDNLKVRDFKLAFLIMLVGFVISVICFVIEICCFKCIKKLV